MNHDETKAAIHLSLLMGDTKSERHGCYPLRKPRSTTPPPEIPPLPTRLPHVFGLPVVRENPRPPL
jgi:hypothetical protein